MTARQQLYDGKAKTIFTGPSDDTLIQYFKDDATAFNAVKHDILDGKGILNNLISEHVMLHLGDQGIATHFIERLNRREQLIRKVSIIPIEVVVRNAAAGSLVKRLAGEHIRIAQGDPLPAPMIEYYLKEDALNDPIICRDHVLAFGLASEAELEAINAAALTINRMMQAMFAEIDITLVDFKLEFGRTGAGDVLLADEISPDNCRLWDKDTGEKKDKDRFREDLGGLVDAYRDIAERFGINLAELDDSDEERKD